MAWVQRRFELCGFGESGSWSTWFCGVGLGAKEIGSWDYAGGGLIAARLDARGPVRSVGLGYLHMM